MSGTQIACDQQGLVAMGLRYETGDGVPQDYRKAASLYRAAARSQPGTIYVYSPPVGKESYGRVIPVLTGPGRAPLPEAQYRLALLHLKGAGVDTDRQKAEKLLQAAAGAGYAPAAKTLSSM